MGPSILLLTEDADTRSIFSAVLGRRGYSVRTAANAASAALEVKRDLPALLITERLAYIRGGEIVLRAMRESAQVAVTTRVLAVTARPLDAEGVNSVEPIYDSVMLTPVPLRSLLAEVERLIGVPEADADGPVAMPQPQ